MSFPSFEFLVFFLLVLLFYFRMSHRWQNHLLLVGSYVFYGWWDWRFLSLIVLSSCIDYYCGQKVDRQRSPDLTDKQRKWFVAISMFSNLGLLCTFKYFGFFVTSLQALFGRFHLPFQLDTLHIILPLGISFYTFQTMSYTIDIYRGEVSCCKRWTDFFLFVSFFPQLVAGPIERAKSLLPQIENPRSVSEEKISSGLQLILFGFFKKMVIADNLALFVNSTFASHNKPVGYMVMLGAYAFAFQIYADFSGYTDIARGCARIMGFDLRKNFRMPYFATNPSDFWQRWHISLSTWLRDYLYIPLGGNRKGNWNTIRNLFLTMFFGGLWHGASWNFVLWGIYHGLLLAVFRAFSTRRKARQVTHQIRSGLWMWLKVFAFFQLVCVGWLMFRIRDLSQLLQTFKALAYWPSLDGTYPTWTAVLFVAVFCLPLYLFDYYRYRKDHDEPWLQWSLPKQVVLVLFFFYSIVLYGSPYATTFIYFQF